jgi:hypothetical protein
MSSLSRETRDLLAQVRAHDHMSAADKARIRGKLAHSLRMGVAAGTATVFGTSLAQAARASVLGKLPLWAPATTKMVAAVAVTTAVGVGAVRMVQSNRVQNARARSMPTQVESAHARSVMPSVTASPRPDLVVPAEVTSESTSSVAGAVPSIRAQATPPWPHAPRRVETEASAPERPVAPSTLTVEPAEVVPVPAQNSDALLKEMTAVRQARTALRSGHAAQALQLIDAAQLSGTYSTFGQEAMLIRVQSYCALNNVGAAYGLASRFIARNPSSPWVSKLQQTCAFQDSNR